MCLLFRRPPVLKFKNGLRKFSAIFAAFAAFAAAFAAIFAFVFATFAAFAWVMPILFKFPNLVPMLVIRAL
jgi:hypothetical protein